MNTTFYRTLTLLFWPEDGRARPKHVAKYNLIVIIASCLDACCVLTMYNILYKFGYTQRDNNNNNNNNNNNRFHRSFLGT